MDNSKLVNPELLKHSIIEHNGKPVEVTKLDSEFIFIKGIDSDELKITDSDWTPIFLSEEWLEKLGLKVDQSIRNVRNNLDWTIRKMGRFHYLTIKRDPSLGENPVISIHAIHDLQHWYFLLTREYLKARVE